MSSRYPVLDNRPIDQWKVTELKEELKKRKLTIKGLKDDLIKCLDEALRIEREAAEADAEAAESDTEAAESDAEAAESDAEVAEADVEASAAELNNSHAEIVAGEVDTINAEEGNAAIVEPVEAENAEKDPEVVDNDSKKSDVPIPVDINSSALPEVEHKDFPAGADSTDVGEGLIVPASTMETTVTVTDNVLTEVVASGQNSYGGEPHNDHGQDSVPNQEKEESKSWMDNEDSKPHAAIVEPVEAENAEKNPEVVDNDSKKSDIPIPVDINSSALPEVEHKDFPAGANSTNVEEGLIVPASTTETTVTVTDNVLTEVVASGQDSYGGEPHNDYGKDPVPNQEKEESKSWMDNEDSKPQLECDQKPPCEDLMPNYSLPGNQVSEVNPSLGCQVKSDSISCNSMSINQKNELKDTIIADNVKLEQDIVRPEMLEEPSSRNDVPVYDESHSMDAGELNEKKASVEENSNNNRSPDLSKINSSEDVGYPEQLNLDRSSGDDFMEEDLPESKQFDSRFNFEELRDKGESVEVPIGKEEDNTVDMEDGISPEKGGTHLDNDMPPAFLVEKRKFHDHLENSVTDQASVGNNEPAKRQRRWNSDSVKGSDAQIPSPRPATTPNDELIGLKRNFSRSDSLVNDDAPKERIVLPSEKAATNSLRIDRFLRPFTLKAVQELLGKTGKVTSFWMDQIKTHCYVTYSSVEEAVETRNSVYNLQWPPNGGRLLVAEYVNPEEVKMKLEAPPTQVASATPAQAASGSNSSTVPPAMPTSQPQPSPRQRREQPPVPATLPPPPTLSKPSPPARERLPSPPPLPEKVDQPIVTLDDLFRKTRATPRIYYLPLSKEQVAAKLAAQGRSIKH